MELARELELSPPVPRCDVSSSATELRFDDFFFGFCLVVFFLDGAWRVLNLKNLEKMFPPSFFFSFVSSLFTSLRLSKLLDMAIHGLRTSSSSLVWCMLICKWHHTVQVHMSSRQKKRVERHLMVTTTLFDDHYRLILVGSCLLAVPFSARGITRPQLAMLPIILIIVISSSFLTSLSL